MPFITLVCKFIHPTTYVFFVLSISHLAWPFEYLYISWSTLLTRLCYRIVLDLIDGYDFQGVKRWTWIWFLCSCSDSNNRTAMFTCSRSQIQCYTESRKPAVQRTKIICLGSAPGGHLSCDLRSVFHSDVGAMRTRRVFFIPLPLL
jgi:hypothetical protein